MKYLASGVREQNLTWIEISLEAAYPHMILLGLVQLNGDCRT